MKIAVCVAAYQAPRVFAQAVGAYKQMGWYVYAHLDAKCDIDAYRAEMAEAASIVHFLPDRIPIFWAGISQVEAQFGLFTAALNDGADRVVYLTDDTLPIRPLPDIDAGVREEIDRLLLSRIPLDDDFSQRYHGFFIHDHVATNPRGGGARELDGRFFALSRECDGLRMIGKKRLQIYWGLAYRVLTRGTISRVMAICDSDPHLMASFCFACVPEELVIPCVISNYMPDTKTAPNPVFMDFSRGHGPLTYASVNELPEGLPDHYLFARKFAPP
jgi:hypothetical protein